MASAKKRIKKMVKAFYRQYIKKHHSFILCKHEKRTAMKLGEILHASRSVYFVRPHGVKVRIRRRQGITRPSDLAIEVIRALIHLIDLVHEAGYSFVGQLSLDNLYWLPDSKTIKIWGLMTGVMVKKTEQGVMLDFASIHDLIRDRLFPAYKIPNELRHLMKLLKSDPIRYGNLIRHNICLLDDENKVGRYVTQFQKLMQVKKLDESMYREALKHLKCGKCKGDRNWQKDILYHDALVSVFYHGENKVIPANEEGVSVFGRHSCHHLLRYSVETVKDSGNKNGTVAVKKVKFSVADIFPLLEFFIPGLFSELQEAVFEIIEIKYPQELEALRNKTTGGA